MTKNTERAPGDMSAELIGILRMFVFPGKSDAIIKRRSLYDALEELFLRCLKESRRQVEQLWGDLQAVATDYTDLKRAERRTGPACPKCGDGVHLQQSPIMVTCDNSLHDYQLFGFADFAQFFVAAPAPGQDGWVSVADKLPEHNKAVIVFGDEFIGVARLRKSGIWSRNYDEEYEYAVTHWRELPAPPSPAEPSKGGK